MIEYTGSDKRIKALFDNIYTQYTSGSKQYLGKWINFDSFYRMVLVATISNSPSVDEVIYDLSWFSHNLVEIEVATLVATNGKMHPIAHELYVDGDDLVYNGDHGTGTAYVTIRFTE